MQTGGNNQSKDILKLTVNMGGAMIRRYIISLVLVGLIFLISGCGGGGGGGNDVVAPAESTITISGAPETISIGTSSTSWYEYCCFVIVVKDANGIPLNGVDLSISYPWAIPNPPGLVQFYDGNTPKDSPLNVTTDENGAYYLKIGYQGGLVTYTGSIIVVSGSVSTTATFAVDTGS